MDKIICDIDGTIADLTHRLKYVRNLRDDTYWRNNWNAFHKGCVFDTPKQDVIRALTQMASGVLLRPLLSWRAIDAIEADPIGAMPVYFLSGRNSVVREETVAWLREHIPLCKDWDDHTFDKHLHMRRKKDRRPDTVIKAEMAAKVGLIPENTLCVFEDRQCVVDMWRELGFLTLQVAAWSE